MTPSFGGRLTWVAAIAAAAPALAALAWFGIVLTPDSAGYLRYADQLAEGLPRGESLLAEAPAPISLFRAPGYPILLWLLGPRATVALQVLLAALLAVLVLRVGLALRLSPARAGLAAAATGFGFGIHQTVAILPDAVAAAAVAAASLLLALAAIRARRAVPAALAAGLLLAAATVLREATPYLALFLLPLGWLAGGAWRRGLACCAALLVPPWLALAGLGAWNTERAGTPVTTTSRQVVLVQALLPVLKRGIVLHAGDDPYDRAARAILRGDRYESVVELNEWLYRAGFATAIDLSRLAADRYTRAWRTHPGAMLRASITRFRVEHLALAFDPGRTIGFILNHTGRRDTLRLDRLAAAAGQGSVAAGAGLVLVAAGRALGLAVGLLALAAPLLLRRRGDPRWPVAAALWLVVAAPFAVYLPVHIEPRYLAPSLPLVPLLAALGLAAGLASAARLRHTPPARAPAPG